jgi:hypothetical protein
VNADVLPKSLGGPNLGGESVGRHHLARSRSRQTDLGCQLDQHVLSAGVAALTVVGAQQGPLQGSLRPGLTLDAGPVKQTMRIERVPYVRAHAKLEPFGRAACRNSFMARRQLLVGHSVLILQILRRVGALGRHSRIELERLHMQLDVNVGADALECALERAQTDCTPGASDIGNEIDPHAAGL